MAKTTHRGYFGIGLVNSKHASNLGTLWRGAYQLGAAFIFTIGRRYDVQSSDVIKTYLDVPLHFYPDMPTFWESIPFSCPVVAIEMGGEPLQTFTHPERCIYLLGAEDNGLSKQITERAHFQVALPHVRDYPSFNVAQSGTIVMYDRLIKQKLPA